MPLWCRHGPEKGWEVQEPWIYFCFKFLFSHGLCIGLGSVSFEWWVSQRKGIIRFQDSHLPSQLSVFCLPGSSDFLNTLISSRESRTARVSPEVIPCIISLTLAVQQVLRDHLFLLLPVPVGGWFVTISPNAPTDWALNPIVIKIDTLLDCLLQTLLQGQFGSTSAEYWDITVITKMMPTPVHCGAPSSWLGVAMHRFPREKLSKQRLCSMLLELVLG